MMANGICCNLGIFITGCQLKLINPQRTCTARITVVVLCVRLSVCTLLCRLELVYKCQTEGTSGTSGLLIEKAFFCLVRELECLLLTMIDVHHFISLHIHVLRYT